MLTDTKIKASRAKEKLYRISDTNGLKLEVTPKGVKHWRYRYRFNGKESMVSIGKYPLVSLAKARIIRDEYRVLLTKSINPSTAKADKKIEVLADEQKRKTFSEMFYAWHSHNKDSWSKRHISKVLQQGEKYLFPHIGNKTIGSINPQDLIAVFKTIEQRGTLETLQKIKSHASRVFRYCVGLGMIEHDPTRDLPSDIFKKPQTKHYATVTNPKEIAELLKTIDSYQGSYQIESALKIAPYLFLRPSELSGLEWKEVDIDNKIIRIDAQRMKMRISHLVPLSKQVLSMLKHLQTIKTDSKFVFPSLRNPKKSISPESLRAALRRSGISKDKFTTHGFRHMASTRLNEMGFNTDVIERQLAHAERNKVRAAYNHAEYLKERKKMMQKWADYLDELKDA